MSAAPKTRAISASRFVDLPVVLGVHRVVVRRAFVALVVWGVLRGVCYALIIPPWQAPDETGHFEYAWAIAHLGRLPTAQDASPQFERALIRSLYQYRHEAYNPAQVLPDVIPSQISMLPGHVARARTLLWGRFSLSYVFSALMIVPVRDEDLITQLYAARLASVVLNGVILLVAFLIFREIDPARPQVALLSVALVCVMPYHTFINSVVGDGTFAELVAAGVLLCWVRVLRRGVGFWEGAGIFLGMVLSLWAKATSLFLIPSSLIMAGWWLVVNRARVHFSLRVVVIGAVLCFGAVVLVMMTSNPLHYYVVVIGQGVVSLFDRGRQGEAAIDILPAVQHTISSFLANFGDTAFTVSAPWHAAFHGLVVAALIGWGGGWVGRRGVLFPPGVVFMMWVFVVVACVGLVVWGMILNPNYAQGRYLLPIIVPFTFLFVQGLLRLVPVRAHASVAALLVVMTFTFDLWCMFGYIIPYFFA